MSTARSALRRVREELEESLTPVQARAVLFDALNEWGPHIPSDQGEFVRFVRSPLRHMMVSYITAEQSGPILVRIENMIAVVDFQDDAPPSVHPPPIPSENDPEVTAALPAIGDAPVGVLVVSSNETFADVLQLSMGRDEVTTSFVGESAHLAKGLAAPLEIVLVDGGYPTNIEPTWLAGQLNGLGSAVWLTIWGAEHPYGREVRDALEAGGVHCVPLVTSEGIAPFIDLVRSRRA